MTSVYDETMKSKNFLPLQLDGLTAELKRKASWELKESEDSRARHIKDLQARAFSVEGLNPKTEDAFFLQFLRARKFDPERSFKLLLEFYKVKRAYKDVYSSFDFEKNRTLLSTGHTTVLPYRNRDGSAVVVFRMNCWDPHVHDMVTVVRNIASSVLYLLEFPATQVSGLHVIYDVKDCELKHVRAFSPYYLRLLSRGLRNAFPMRFKGLHFYNESLLFRYIWAILRIFLNEKIINRVHFHGDNPEKLHNYVSKEILPEMYGGDNKDNKLAEWSAFELENFYPVYYNLTQTGYDMQS